MYELQKLTRLSKGRWLCVVLNPGGRAAELTWITNDCAADVRKRAADMIARMQCDYCKLSGFSQDEKGEKKKVKGKAVSHWRALAATGPHNDNTTRIKQIQRAKIEEYLNAGRRKSDD